MALRLLLYALYHIDEKKKYIFLPITCTKFAYWYIIHIIIHLLQNIGCITFYTASVDFYLSNVEASNSTIVWTDPENDYLVNVDGFFSQEELMELSMNLIKKDIPVPED